MNECLVVRLFYVLLHKIYIHIHILCTDIKWLFYIKVCSINPCISFGTIGFHTFISFTYSVIKVYFLFMSILIISVVFAVLIKICCDIVSPEVGNRISIQGNMSLLCYVWYGLLIILPFFDTFYLTQHSIPLHRIMSRTFNVL